MTKRPNIQRLTGEEACERLKAGDSLLLAIPEVEHVLGVSLRPYLASGELTAYRVRGMPSPMIESDDLLRLMARHRLSPRTLQ